MKRSLVVVVALALLLAAAGAAAAQTTTTPPSTTPSSTASTKTVRGVTDSSITVGGLQDSFVYGGADIGAKARFQRANDSGGVNGRTIDYRGAADDGGDPNAGLTAAKKLVGDDGVFAVVPTVTPDFSSASSYLVEQKVPYFGWALSSDFCGNRYGFGITGCPFPAHATSNAWPLLISKALPKRAKGSAVAIVAESTTSGQYDVASLSAAAKSVKLKVSYAQASLGVPATPDYDAITKNVLASNNGGWPDAVFVLGGVSNVLGMQQALVANNYFGFFTNQIEYAPNLVAPAVRAIVLTQMAPSETAATNPAMQQLVADVQKVAPDQPIDQSVMAGYWAADMFLAAVQKAGRNLTPATLQKAANTKFTYEVPKTIGPTKFPAAHSLPTPCGALVSSDGTAYSVTQPYTCGRVVRVK